MSKVKYTEPQFNDPKKQVLIHPEPGDVLLIETDTHLSKDRKFEIEKQLTANVGCRVVIIDGGMKVVKLDSTNQNCIFDSKAIYNGEFIYGSEKVEGRLSIALVDADSIARQIKPETLKKIK